MMIALIYLFGAFLIVAGISLVVNPDYFFNLLKKNVQSTWMHVAAIAVRAMFGGIFIYSADASKFPLVVSILGWTMIVAALILLVIGRKNLEKLVSWALAVFQPFGWIGGVFSLIFGLFLIYAFI